MSASNLDRRTTKESDSTLAVAVDIVASPASIPSSQLLEQWNETACVYPAEKGFLHRQIEEQTASAPGGLAVFFEGQELTYGELNCRANQLARKLISLGAAPGVLIGVFMERSLEMVVGLLGILKTGAAYVPIDPSYPAERIAYMIEDSRALVLLTQKRFRDTLPLNDTKVLYLDGDWHVEFGLQDRTNPEVPLAEQDLAYLIYTSGSTGKPKGAMNTHGGIRNRLLWMQAAYGLTSEDRVLQKTPFSFDVSVWEFFWPLMTGAVLVMAQPGGHQDSGYLTKLVRQQRITTIHFVPSMLRAFLEDPDVRNCTSLRRVICSGEALPLDLKKGFFSKLNCELHNLYGPTEASVDVTCWECRKDDGLQVVPIGRPIANTQIHILDSEMRPCAISDPGELYIGGTGLARGYWERPELTAERFLPNPLARKSGERMYRTGDIARYRADGAIEYLGRIDQQVKLRGFRIELGEIEAALLRHAQVENAVVVLHGKNAEEKRLIAYLVLRNNAENLGGRSNAGSASSVLSHESSLRPAAPALIAELNDHLRAQLPAYMAPSAFVVLEQLQLSPNGKIDRKALPEVPAGWLQQRMPYEPPRTAAEIKIAQIWESVLCAERLGIHDNFFELGGHSLLATQAMARLRAELDVDVPVKKFFELPTIHELAAFIDKTGPMKGEASNAVVMRRGAELPLSFSQERVWFLERLNPGILAYNYQALIRFHGSFSVPAFEQALQEIIRRHEICRTTFSENGGRPVQVIHAAHPVKMPVIDLQKEADPEARAQELIRLELKKPFDLEKLPLIYWVLFQLGPENYLILHKEHHMLHDGWSFNLFLNELFTLYKGYTQGSDAVLPHPLIQFADFACWQRQWMTGEEAAKQLNFWSQNLAGSPGLLMLPSDRPRPVAPTFKGAVCRVELPLKLCAALRAGSREQKVTLFMSMFSAFAILLYRLSGNRDFCVGSGIANRRWKETEGLLGMLVNNVVLRIDLSGNPSVRQILCKVKELTLEAYANQDVPFDKVVEALHPVRELSHNPLFQVMFSFHDSPLSDFDLPGSKVTVTETISNKSAKWDMNIIVIPRAEQKLGNSKSESTQGITIVWEYTSDLFDPETMERWVAFYQNILGAMFADPEQRIDDLPLLTMEEREKMLGEGVGEKGEYPREAGLAELLEEQVRQRGGATAVVYEGKRLSYEELNRRGNRVAWSLRKKGVKAEERVGICMERSLEMVIGLVGIVKAGGAYVAIEEEYPEERKQWMMQDTGMKWMVVEEGRGRELELRGERGVKVEVVEVAGVGGKEEGGEGEKGKKGEGEEWEENPRGMTGGENLAYVVYTSGSTGKPKGVGVTQRGVVRLVKGTNYVELGEKEKMLQLAPLSFDASTLEVWGSLLNGGELVVMKGGKPGLEAIGKAVREEGITTLWLTAGLFQVMVEEQGEDLKGVKQLLAGGDVLSVRHVEQYVGGLGPGGRKLINGYGPTENTTFTCCYGMEAGEEIGNSVPIGRAIANTEVYVLDGKQEIVGLGMVGELYAGGDGLARGYMGRADLTAEKFVPHPYSRRGGERLYRTGDLVRNVGGGVLEFVGRMDEQVKIRGYRIEPGEIEGVLGEAEWVRGSAVVVEGAGAGVGEGEKRLVAYVVTEEGREKGEVREYLRGRLPEYMVPERVVLVRELPLTENGKVDRKKLRGEAEAEREKEGEGEREGGSYVGPRNEVEEAIAGVWAEMLGRERIGIHENFFDLGGHSLLAMQMVSRIKQIFGANIELRKVFELPVISNLAKLVSSSLGRPERHITPVERRNLREFAASFAQRRLWFMNSLVSAHPIYNLPAAHLIKGFIDVPALEASLNEIIRRHEALRTRFVEIEGDAKQVVEPHLEIKIRKEDLSGTPGGATDELLQIRMKEEGRRPFDLQQLPLLRATLFRLGVVEHVLLIVMHHIIADGPSLAVFYRELGALYSAYKQGLGSLLKPLPVQYIDFALWQEGRLGELKQELNYWSEHLAGAPELLQSPADYPPLAPPSYIAGSEYFELNDDATRDLKELGRKATATLFMTLLTVYAMLLSRSRAQEEILVGAPISNREQEELQGLIGFFTNMLVLRVDLRGDPSFMELLKRVKQMALEAYAHQELPFEMLVEQLRPARNLYRNPLFQASFNLIHGSGHDLHLADLDSTPITADLGTAKFDLHLEVHEYNRRLRFRFIYNIDLFSAATAKNLCRRLENLIAEILKSEDCPISKLDLLFATERLQPNDNAAIAELEESFQL